MDLGRDRTRWRLLGIGTCHSAAQVIFPPEQMGDLVRPGWCRPIPGVFSSQLANWEA